MLKLENHTVRVIIIGLTDSDNVYVIGYNNKKVEEITNKKDGKYIDD